MIVVMVIIRYYFMFYFPELDHIAHYKAKKQSTVNVNFHPPPHPLPHPPPPPTHTHTYPIDFIQSQCQSRVTISGIVRTKHCQASPLACLILRPLGGLKRVVGGGGGGGGRDICHSLCPTAHVTEKSNISLF